ncbi:unnamed protein product [Symbiodinium sp. CCMP2456]|nr:unnamed protein product [Symbiodinium sp. CCMP2456]
MTNASQTLAELGFLLGRKDFHPFPSDLGEAAKSLGHLKDILEAFLHACGYSYHSCNHEHCQWKSDQRSLGFIEDVVSRRCINILRWIPRTEGLLDYGVSKVHLEGVQPLLQDLREFIDSRLSWASPKAAETDVHQKLEGLRQEIQELRKEFAPASVAKDTASKLDALRQETHDLRNDFAPTSMVTDMLAEIDLLRDLKQHVIQLSVKVDQLQHSDGRCQVRDHLDAHASISGIEGSRIGCAADLAEGCRQLQEIRSTFVKIVADTMEAQQHVFDSLRREQWCLMQHVTVASSAGQLKPSTVVPAAAASSSDSVSEASWVCLSCGGSDTQGRSSVRSGISVETSGNNCFMHDAAFKSETGALLPGSALHKGSRVLAADASVLEVANDPEDHEARATVVLKAGAAELEVRAQDLRIGDEVLVGGLGPARLQYVDVKFEPVMVRKIVFEPDLPVEVLKPSILSHGDKQSKRIRRGGRSRRGSEHQEKCTIPDTEGYLTD